MLENETNSLEGVDLIQKYFINAKGKLSDEKAKQNVKAKIHVI